MMPQNRNIQIIETTLETFFTYCDKNGFTKEEVCQAMLNVTARFHVDFCRENYDGMTGQTVKKLFCDCAGESLSAIQLNMPRERNTDDSLCG